MRIIILSLAFLVGPLYAAAQVSEEINNDIVVAGTVKQDTNLTIMKDIRRSVQRGFELSAGLGAPECLNLKIKYGGRLQAGASAGWQPDFLLVEREINLSIALDFYLHFARSKTTDQFKWYFNSGISKLFPETDYEFSTITEYPIVFYSRLGRSFNFNQRIGVSLDLGIMLSHVRETAWYSPMYTAAYGHPVLKYDFDGYDPYPSLSFSFFVRL